MKQLAIMLKPASSLCNMDCSYCFYKQLSLERTNKSYGLADKNFAKRIIDNVFCCLDDKDSISFMFQGGEPTLIGLDFFEYFVWYASSQKVKPEINFSLQTNGLLLDEDWCKFLKKNNFLVGLSLDGNITMHDKNRLDLQGKGTYNKVLSAKKMLDKHNVEYNILCTLTNQAAAHPQRIWDFIIKNNIKYIQLTPCIGNQKAVTSLTPERFESFYNSLFSLWLRHYKNQNYVSIKFFDDILNLFYADKATACGISGSCCLQIVVESDGSVFPCDFYAVDEYKVKNLCQTTIKDVYESIVSGKFLNTQPEAPVLCKQCKYFKRCGGGCRRIRSTFISEQKGFCGLKGFLDKNLMHFSCLAD